MKQDCPLCQTPAPLFFTDTQRYCKCPTCDAVFVVREDLPKEDAEKERYELHDDDTANAGYRKFVSPITSNILKDFTQNDKGLDFGAGRSAIISTVLREHAYDIADYDPYFHNHPELLDRKYDYISSCEVIEHFYNPKKEFELLCEMLREGGKLYLMTDVYDESIDFASWYYKNDPTHVFLYTKKTFEYIKEFYGFRELTIEKRLIIITK
ncbi:class I SAM-dependent methyltransferase [Sulfurimonas paralvinellae]|uniref:Class I SAM-dependent methyltransferase n=1 Tax=Sulfurimonas paralvinellae TaxID=317658 RepID=A0A7M1B8A3_9BACT|nr:class I SAM-dependent methyltransferase [Sulfurimonas paralvinellae]QOP45934.1 class I SAM-dependent methyltransferase [Sulfurimonas paralvinellae]